MQERGAREDAERKATAAEAGAAAERRRRRDVEAKLAAEASTKLQQGANDAGEKVFVLFMRCCIQTAEARASPHNLLARVVDCAGMGPSC